MNNYKFFANTLLALLGDTTAVRIKNDPFIALSIEDIGCDAEGHRLVSICHYGEQNGDLMRDPDMVFAFHDWHDYQAAEPISFRNDYMGLNQEVYQYDDQGKRTHVNTRLKKDLASFALTWFRNIKEQGFLNTTVNRERLS